MMTDYEMLVELLDEAFCKSDDNFGVPNVKQVANYLIAHGTTVRKWFSVNEMLPEEFGIFEVMDATKGVVGFAGFNPDKRLFEVFPSQHFVNVTHWKYIKAKGYYYKVQVPGRWIWKDSKCFCSVCLKQGDPKRYYEDGTVEEYDFCPNCGVKMMTDS